MNFFQRFLSSNFLIKLRSWEYWPFGIIQAPIFLYWMWLAIKSRSLFFFSASNPGILMGGMFGESKFDVLKKVPERVQAKSIFVRQGASKEALLLSIRQSGLSFPLIFKPDLGERGWRVKKVCDDEEAVIYLNESPIDFLVQEFVDLPLEFGVFYIRQPNDDHGRVISVVGKEMLSVTGDGKSTLRKLIISKERAKLQWEKLSMTFYDRLDDVLVKDEVLELVSIGNHCLGTKFLNCNHLITERLSDSFDQISLQVEGFYFGRYDLRVKSVEDLEAGNVKVLELNGCGAEPAHIYQPGSSLWKGIGVLFEHWQNIYRISRENHRRGVAYVTFSQGKAIYQRFKSVVS